MKNPLLISLFIVVAILTSPLAQGKTPVSPATTVRKPNIVLFLVDDMTTADLEHLPTLSQFATKGIRFTRFVSPTPVCAPSRTSILRGQYSHNTYQLYNSGIRPFHLTGFDQETVAVWLQRAGYATALFGKYLNGYLVNTPYIPPGWTEWYAGGQPAGYEYTLNENGIPVKYLEPGPYINDELAHLAAGFIERHHDEPMFLYISSTSPHAPVIPAHRYEKLFRNAQLPQGPSFNEEDVSDKPKYIQKLSKIPADEPVRLEKFRNRLRSLRSISDLIKTVTVALTRYGVRDNTYFVFLSDNGWVYGDHRIYGGKIVPYEAANIVPAWIWGPGIPSGSTRNHLVANSDLAQTFAEWAGAQVPSFVDGRSLVPVLKSEPIPISEWRQAILLAYDENIFHPFPTIRNSIPHYFGLLTNSEKYVRYETHEEEYYLHASDPYEMQSQHANPLWKNRTSELLRWAQAFGNCYGEVCRLLDRAPPAN